MTQALQMIVVSVSLPGERSGSSLSLGLISARILIRRLLIFGMMLYDQGHSLKTVESVTHAASILLDSREWS